MNKERKKKNIVIALLCVAILGLGIGYAALASNLTINGQASITSTWNVQITEAIQEGKAVGSAQGEVSHTANSATFSATLKEPGDAITFKVTVKNQGTIPATLKTLVKKEESEKDAIIYTVSEDSPKQGDALAATSGVHVFKITATYDPTAKGENAPTEGEMTETFTINLGYEQVV